MAILLHMDFVLPKIFSKKARGLLSNKLTNVNTIKRINPEKILELTEDGNLTMELTDELVVECHVDGCFHVHCEDLDERRLNLIGKALVPLSKAYDLGKVSKEVRIVLMASERNVPRKKIMKMIKKAFRKDFEAQFKDLYQEDIKPTGIRFISAPNMSLIVDITGISVRMGPLKMSLDRFKDETTVIELIEKSMAKIRRFLEA